MKLLSLVLVLLAGCAHWDTPVRAGINGTAHALRAVDTVLADRYTAESSGAPFSGGPSSGSPAPDLTALEARYHPALDAERITLVALLAAESAVDTAVATGTATDKCRVRVALASLATETARVITLASGLGAPIPSEATLIAQTMAPLIASFVGCP